MNSNIDGSFLGNVDPSQLQDQDQDLLARFEFGTNLSLFDTPFTNYTDYLDAAVNQIPWQPLTGYAHALPLVNNFTPPRSPQLSNTPSPSTDIIFSSANSPGDVAAKFSHSDSPVTTIGDSIQDSKPTSYDDSDEDLQSASDDDSDHGSSRGVTPEVDLAWPPVNPPQVYVHTNKTKTRAETQMKVTLILDPLDSRIGHIQFPRTKLAKAKQMATREEEKKVKNEGNILRMEMVLVCATAIQQPEDRHRALRRAAGVEPIPRRCPEVTLSDMEKTDPARPQNGGEVVICANCKERERKRNDRKKKRTDDEEEWDGYGDHRIIMINEKQYKEFKPVETSDLKLSPQAKQVDFAMRIACYCRHQEDKSPVGYRVIFTFKDSAGQLVAQCVSDTLQVTDDHKNKEGPERPRPLTIPPQPQQDFLPMQYAPYTYGMGGQYPVAFNATSQPASPLMPAFQSPISPMQGQFSPVGTPSFVPVNRPSFSGAVTAPIIPQYVGHQQPFSIPMTSPTSQVAQGTQYIPRVHSMSSFNFTAPMSYAMSDPVYHSEPASASGTPYNLSRPASPQWEQNVKKKPMLGYGSGFY